MAAIVGGILLIILGAVVAFAVDFEVARLDTSIVGIIIVVIGLVVVVFGLGSRRRPTEKATRGKRRPDKKS
jgi:membrane protein DedA with SNARE-associated domain